MTTASPAMIFSAKNHFVSQKDGNAATANVAPASFHTPSPLQAMTWKR